MATILRRRTVSAAPTTDAEATDPVADAAPPRLSMRHLPRRVQVAVASAPPIPPRVVMRRTLRVTSNNTAIHRAERLKVVRAEIDEALQALAKNEQQLDEVMAEQERIHGVIEKLLRDNNLNVHHDAHYETGIAEAFSRQSTYVDPKKFKAAVSNADFFKCIEVMLGKAREVMAQKELDRISDITPGKSQGFKFYVKPRTRKK